MKTLKIFASVIVALVSIFAFGAAGAATVASFGIFGGISATELEKYSEQNISGMNRMVGITGEVDNRRYDGGQDHLLSFGAPGRSFASATDSGRVFVYTITNAHATDVLTTYLLPGLGWYAGQAVDGIMKDGAYYDTAHKAGLTASASPTTIAAFFAYIQNNPTQLLNLRIEGTTTSQVQQQITVEELDPFRSLGTRIINLNTSQTEMTYRDKIATLNCSGMVLSDQFQMKLPIPIGTTTITFYCGGTISLAHGMKSKMTHALQTFTAMGGQEVAYQNEAYNQLAAGYNEAAPSATPAALPTGRVGVGKNAR